MLTLEQFLIKEDISIEDILNEVKPIIAPVLGDVRTTNIKTNTADIAPNQIQFKGISRVAIITIVSMMLDSLNKEYMSQHNNLPLWNTQSIKKKLLSM